MEKRSYKILNLVTASIYAIAWTACAGAAVVLTVMSSDSGFSFVNLINNPTLSLVYFYIEFLALWMLPCVLILVHAGYKGFTKFVGWSPVIVLVASMFSPSNIIPMFFAYSTVPEALGYAGQMGLLRLMYIIPAGYVCVGIGVLSGKIIRFIKRKIREREEAILAEDLGEYDED